MGRSSVEATNALRICAVRAIRCALLARRPLLVGLRLFALLLLVLLFALEVFAADASLLPDFAFAVLDLAALLLDALLLLLLERVEAGFWSSAACPAIGEKNIRSASTAARLLSAAGRTTECRRKWPFILSLYLHL